MIVASTANCLLNTLDQFEMDNNIVLFSFHIKLLLFSVLVYFSYKQTRLIIRYRYSIPLVSKTMYMLNQSVFPGQCKENGKIARLRLFV